jgi:hypothetical protein
MKVPVLVAYFKALNAADRELSETDRSDATAAIEESSNDAINSVFARLEQLDGGLLRASGAIEAVLRDAGDMTTHVNTVENDEGFSTFGQTEWSAANSALFYRALAHQCLLPRPEGGYLLQLMRRVIAGERWGAGEAGFPESLPLAFKGGWGPEPDGPYLVRQTAIVGSRARGYVLGMIAHPQSTGEASFAAGQEMLTRTAAWARQELRVSAPQIPIGCSG